MLALVLVTSRYPDAPWLLPIIALIVVPASALIDWSMAEDSIVVASISGRSSVEEGVDKRLRGVAMVDTVPAAKATIDRTAPQRGVIGVSARG